MSDLRYPQFISLDTSNGSEPFPVAISWSLPDGQLKACLVAPEDDWAPWENNHSDHDTAFLLEQGVSCAEILKELLEDLDGEFLYSLDVENEGSLMAQLFAATSLEQEIQLLPFQDLFAEYEGEELWSHLDNLNEIHELNLGECEDRVRSLILLADALEAYE